MLYGMFFLGRNFVSGLICTLKSEKKPKNIKKLFPQNQHCWAPDHFRRALADDMARTVGR